MANLLRRLRRDPGQSSRYDLDWLADQWQFAFQGSMYGGPATTYGTDKQEPIGHAFGPYVRAAYQADSVVFACILTRLLVFSEARFQWRQMQQGRPADLFGTGELSVLERPWTNGTTGELLARMEQDVSLAGNSFWVRRGDRLVRLRPDCVTIINGSRTVNWWDAEVAGYLVRDPDLSGGTVQFAPEEVAHYSPIPDPVARWRGMSWLTPVVREIQADKAMTAHKLKFFENAATPNLAIKFDPQITAEQVDEFRRIVESHHAGWENAYRTLYLGGGADPTVIGSTMEQMSFKTTQGAGETRIAAAAGVPPVLVGLSEGLQAATYCVPYDGQVWTVGGPKPMGELRVGDRVWSFVDGTLKPRRVLRQWRTGEKTVWRVKTKNRTLRATDNHPVLTLVPGNSLGSNAERYARYEWRAVADLKVGDKVVQPKALPDLADGDVPDEAKSAGLAEHLGFYTVTEIEPDDTEAVYDIEVEGGHSFICDGIVVHNSNYGQARRRFADGTIRPLWRMAAASLQKLVVAPPGADLWYDDRDIPFLREDEKDAAEIAGIQAATVQKLIDAGFDPDAAVQAASTGDMRALTGTHSGLYSVQLQPPNPEGDANGDSQPVMAAAGPNGNGHMPQ